MAEKKHKQEERCGVDLNPDQFRCSVCLELLIEPVTLHCGHSFCQHCIKRFWDVENVKGEYTCPDCRERFSPRPVLRRNNTLAEVVEKLKRSQTQQTSPSAPLACDAPTNVACDFCGGAEPMKATMSCLTCLASYCPAHLQAHYSVPVLMKHQLVSAMVPLCTKICTEHSKLMEIYCQTDKQLVCSLCTVKDHEGHKTVPVSVQKAESEKWLVSTQKKVQERVQQGEEEQTKLSQAEENLKSCAEAAVKDCDKLFDQLISMQKRRSEVKQLIIAQEKTAITQVKELRLQQGKEIAKLRTRDALLERLLHTDDHIYLIQTLSNFCDPPEVSVGAGPPRSFRDVTDCVSELRDQLEAMLKDTWPRISVTASYVDFTLTPEPTTREECLQYRCPLTLDVNSNYAYLYLVDNMHMMKPSPSPYSAHPDRFTKFAQVLCEEGLSKQCYWEVQWYGRSLSAAVSYKDISRTTDDSRFGSNNKSWSLECTSKGYSFHHNNVETPVSGPCSYKIGVYLDYKAGILCFYHVSDSVVLLHKVQTTFTQPLHPGLGLNYEWYDAGVYAQLVKLL
ncbi:E3 ubiquitin-protein ligase TRIM47-like [Scomber japonicus]|uniref:E3 ubiquitin-protein ligase TRIM47-like n=1 Tax=Scomber japonicus TaxID=13676 RepID=UPI002305C2A8|nr:E3 ubiquitin-protein ligase TRIM47-like [Scomber japonicus]